MPPAARRREATIDRITGIQKRLVQGALAPAEKEALLHEIDQLESQEGALREEMARADPRFAALKRPTIPSLEEVRSLLAPDQALLAFQLSTRRTDETLWWSNGGSWVFVITRDSARVLPLPDFDLLAKEIDVFLGTFARRDGLERRAAVRLYDDLLRDALADLPPDITRLVVVPDRELHRLPFEALAPDPLAEPLGARFEISIAPSATIWARWRRSPAPRPPESALALADPALPSLDEPAMLRQSAPWVEGLQLGALPFARSEARLLARLLGDRCRLLEGTAASERRLKRARPEDIGILVLATHAVLDEEHPERSAVLLAPGAADEDGLVQPREIVELPLEGRLVVLSSCSSASGALLRGEGVVGLARAFFEAGARAVVASLWPMRDDEAAAVAGRFYRQLCLGKSVSAALAEARRERMRAGAPAAEWAGLVVLGDGDLVPFPSGPRPAPRWTPVFLPIVAALLAALALFFRRRRRPTGA
jgi:CHAT domain-containing protein